MGGSAYVDEVRNLVLVGKKGNGKSATGNSILNRKAFHSKCSYGGVFSTCELQTTSLENGLTLNVIDTPGLYDFSGDTELIGKEIAKCINLAKDGIHALLVVISLTSRFSNEEEAAVRRLQNFFGSKISDYMIVVFTRGDDLEEHETLDDYLGPDCPEPLMEILKMCGNRRVLFDNRTKDEVKKYKQLNQLLSLVNEVVDKNDVPYTDELFVEFEEHQINKPYEEQLKRMTEMVESKLKETTEMLEKQLAEEKAARQEALAKVEAARQEALAKVEAARQEALESIQMGGSAYVDEVRNLVLVGKTGNGKSATGNSILNREAFHSTCSFGGVTSTCELQTTALENGLILNVIDTPGLYDFSGDTEFIGKEIAKCINLTKDGIHAVLLVLSLTSRFSKEEEAAVRRLQNFFGSKISDYMIVVFTGGDGLEEHKTLDDYLGHGCPQPLKEILKICGNRRILFDNRTKDEVKKYKQLNQLLCLVNEVVDKNDGIPYTDELFVESEEHQIHESYEEQLKRMTEMVESKLKETNEMLEKQLAEEKVARQEALAKVEAAQLEALKSVEAARLEASEKVGAAQRASNEAQMESMTELRKLRENLERAQRETEELRNRAQNGQCAIL